ncbi:MAG: thioredoxin [Bacteroidota bacterium]
MRILALSFLLAASASAQVSIPIPPPPEPILLAEMDAPGIDTAVEQSVAATVSRPGVHVVHFWAPWCGNSRAEFESGWYEVVEEREDVSFSFVTMWNDGDPAADRLARFGIPEADHVRVYGQPSGPWSRDIDERRQSFLGLPVTWTPTTWIFNRGGELAYAFNFGEVSPDMLRQALDNAAKSWDHD